MGQKTRTIKVRAHVSRYVDIEIQINGEPIKLATEEEIISTVIDHMERWELRFNRNNCRKFEALGVSGSVCNRSISPWPEPKVVDDPTDAPDYIIEFDDRGHLNVVDPAEMMRPKEDQDVIR